MSANATAAAAAARRDAVLPRLGFLGAGWIGRHRLHSLVRSGAGAATAIADLSEERAREAHVLAPGARTVRTLDELLDLELDGVVIATPSALHAEQAVTCLERGLAVFCQKPLARTAAENRLVTDAARAADRLLAVDLSYRYTAAMRAVREAIRSGAVGDIVAADLVFHNAYGPDIGWARDPALSGGGCMMDLGIHLVDLAFWVLDFPSVARVAGQRFAHGRRLAPGEPVCEDRAWATIELANGALVRVACSWEAHTGCDAVIAAAFDGTRATAGMHNVDGSFYDFTAELLTGNAAQTLSTPPDEWGGRALVEWSTRLARGDRYDAGIERIIDVAAVLDAVLGR